MSNERTFYLEAGWQLIVTMGPPDTARLVSRTAPSSPSKYKPFRRSHSPNNPARLACAIGSLPKGAFCLSSTEQKTLHSTLSIHPVLAAPARLASPFWQNYRPALPRAWAFSRGCMGKG